jgi:hypothetical protein
VIFPGNGIMDVGSDGVNEALQRFGTVLLLCLIYLYVTVIYVIGAVGLIQSVCARVQYGSYSL